METQEQFDRELEEELRQDYIAQMELQAHEYELYLQSLQDEEPPVDLFQPSTEEELFMQIQNDERN